MAWLAPDVIEDPYPFYGALLRGAPVYQLPGTDVYLVSSWQLIHEVLRNQDDYSANLTGIVITGEQGEPTLFDFSRFGGSVDAIANADEPHHSIHRKLVLPQLTARKVEVLEHEVREWADRGIATLLDTGGGDCVGRLANDIPVMVMARMTGLPVEDLPQLLSWAFSGGEILAGTNTLADMVELGTATAAMSEYLLAKLQERVVVNSTASAIPAADVLDELVRGISEGLISEREAVSILVVLVGAAGESTSSLIGSAIRLLAQDTALQQRLREAPELIEPFIEEVLRLESPFKGHYRALHRATELGGVAIGKDARVFLLWAAANRDPAVFSDPNQLCLSRPNSSDHLAFGHGIHFCIGARLARMEARIVIAQLLQNTRQFTLDERLTVRHVPSIFVRRLAQLQLRVSA